FRGRISAFDSRNTRRYCKMRKRDSVRKDARTRRNGLFQHALTSRPAEQPASRPLRRRLFLRVEKSRIRVVKAFQLLTLDLLADKVLDRRRVFRLVLRQQRERVALLRSAARAADAVNVILRIKRHVE